MKELKKVLDEHVSDSSETEDISEDSPDTENKIFPDEKKSPSKIAIVRAWFLGLSKSHRMLIVSGGILGLLGIVSIIVLVFKLDSYIFPSSIEGVVLNEKEKPISSARVCAQNTCVATAENGSFVIGGLRYGNTTVNISAEDYREYVEELNLIRGRITQNFTIEPAGYGAINSMLIADVADYDYSRITVLLDDEEIVISPTGELMITDIPVGDHELKVSSPDFMDETYVLSIQDGVTIEETYTLLPAGDISFTPIDWLSGKSLADVSYSSDAGDGVSNDEGSIIISDIPLQDSFEIVLSKEGYNDKEVEVTVDQGANDISNIGMVRSGRVAYFSNRLGNKNVYISNYDGSDEVLLTDNQGDNYSPYLTDDQQTVYFLSTRDAVKNEYGGNIALLYSVPASGGQITKVSATEYEDYSGIGWTNYDAMKRFYVVTDYQTYPYVDKLFYGDIDGTDTQEIYSIKGDISPPVVANNGDFLILRLNSTEDPDKNGVFYLNPSNGSTRKLLDTEDDGSASPVGVSPNRKYALVSMIDPDTNNYDLWIIGIFDDTRTQLTNTSASEGYAQFSPDGTLVSFTSVRDGKEDIYTISIDGSNEQKVTDDGKAASYFWGTEGLIFFKSDISLKIVGINAPGNAQKVTDNVWTYEYYYWN